MATYKIIIGDTEYRIQITETGVKINGEVVQADLLPLNETGLYQLNHGDDKLELHLKFEGNNTYLVTTDGKQVQAQVEHSLGQKRRTTSKKKEKEITAPMPGSVVSVLVQVGDQVEEGQVVCVLESMKMQMMIHAPASGEIAEVTISPGQGVDKSALLVRLG